MNATRETADLRRDSIIRTVEVIPLRIPFRTTYKFAAGARPAVEVVLVRLRSASGVTGVGETQAWRRQGSSETLPRLVGDITEHFVPRLIGRSAFDLAAIMATLDEALSHCLYAKAAVSDALYDLQGRLLGLPVHDLLGGRCRDTLTACAVLPIKATVDATVEHARAMHDRGFRSFTIKIGLDPRADFENVRAVRHALGDAACLRVDANAGMGFDEALILLKRLEAFDLDAAEQPVALWDVDGLAELARRVTIPIMADESVATTHDLIRVIRARAASVVQTKQAKNGGIHHVRQLWTLAAAAGMRIYPGNHPSSSIATAAVLHLAAAWPGPLMAGPFAFGICGELAEDVVKTPLMQTGADIHVPSGPGLGVELDEERVAALRAAL